MKQRSRRAVKPGRRGRTKTKKPKYLSLRPQLSSEKSQQQSAERKMPSPPTNHRQLDPFPLHPANLAEEKDTHGDHNMAHLFSATDGGGTTLTALLASSTTSSSDHDQDNVTASNCKATLSLTVSLSYAAYCGENSEEGALVRTALRNKERDASEERWVCYSEVVERPRSDEEVSSCAVDDQRKLQKLALKLDYQDILSAWSDRGSLYIHAGECPQTVPDDIIYDDVFPHETSNGLQDCRGSNVGVWRVPEMTTNDCKGGCEEEGLVCDELIKFSQREASVLRYKEKRQNRLFAKRIRYEVRKLNAEKRPRVKGRFVKRS